MTEIIVQYDDVDPSKIPADAVAIAGYCGGWWPNYSELVRKFPHAKHKSVAVGAYEDADILDIENGDAVPSEAPDWVRRQIKRGIKPGVYANAATMPEVLRELSSAGITRDTFVVWVAHYTNSKPNAPFELDADAVQWTDHAFNRSLDESVCLPSFWSAEKPVPVTNHPHYEWFIDTPFSMHGEEVVERKVIETYDRLRVLEHPTSEQKLELALTKVRLKWLADRVFYVSHNPLKNGRPTWGEFHRGYRYQQLIHRALGWRFC